MIRRLLIYPAIVCVLWTGTTTTLQDKKITTLDKLSHFIRTTNNKIPYEESYHIASALLTKASPKYRCTLAAIAAVESDYTPSAVGDGGSSRGMFQVQPKHWGKVSSNVYEQVSQAQEVLKTVRSRARYNGSGVEARQYEKKVLRKERLIIQARL